ncbi:MAG TPA: hypothetical protein VKU35_03445 [Candidatus Limnocylindria bacterium]|nr:hypothetical protein [Candidatus Limnocylindria bacterium]
MEERPAPIVLVVDPGEPDLPFGSYRAVLASAGHLLSAELSLRLARQGAAVVPIQPEEPPLGHEFHWGRWFASAARRVLESASAEGRRVDAIGYAGAGSLALLADAELDLLISPVPGEVVANNRFSADAFVVAGADLRGEAAPDGTTRIGPSLARALDRLEACPADNTAVRCLESAGFRSRDLGDRPWSRFDVDTPLDLALLRLATRLPGMRGLDPTLAAFLEMARLPGGGELAVPHLERIGSVLRDQGAELVITGRVPSSVLRELETEVACRVRAVVEERGMRSARGGRPRSLLARWVEERGAASLVSELATLGDAVILDSRVVMAGLSGSSEARSWPPSEERYASDFGDAAPIATPWLRELVEAAAASRVPILMGGHALVSDGLRLVLAAAWLGR